MKNAPVLIFAVLAATAALAEETANPIQHYSEFHGLTAGRVLYEWELDINGDGKKEIFLDTKPTPEEQAQEDADKDQSDSDLHGFTVYIPKPDGSGYYVSPAIDPAKGQVGNVPQIDISQSYVGRLVNSMPTGL